MPFGSSLALSPDIATNVDTNEETFALRFTEDGRGEYSVAGLTLPEKKTLIISHETTKALVERHSVRFDETLVDAELVPATASMYIVTVRPPSTALTEAVYVALANQIVDFLTASSNANVGKVLNFEV